MRSGPDRIESAMLSSPRRYGNEDTARGRGQHVPNGWPHFSHVNGNCLCTDRCCLDGGCKCPGCAHEGHGAPARRRA